MIRVLSIDPGTSNFAIADTLYDFSNGFKFKILGTAMLPSQYILKDMKCANEELAKFRSFIRPVLKQSYDEFAFERFQARGGKGTTIESINIMAGYLMYRMRKTSQGCYLASTWKNAYNRHGDLGEMYEDLKVLRSDRSVPHKTIHELDALLIGMYHVSKNNGLTPFEFISSIKKEQKLLQIFDRSPILKV